MLQGSCQLLHVQAAIPQIRDFVMIRVLLRIRTFVAKRVSLQIRAFLGLFGADFHADIYSDFVQISGLKIGGWQHCPSSKNKDPKRRCMKINGYA